MLVVPFLILCLASLLLRECAPLILHLIILIAVITIIVIIHTLLRQSLCLLSQLLRHLLMPALGGPTQTANPRHLQLKVLVLAVLMCDVDYACGFLDALLECQVAFGQIQLLELGFGGLTTFACCGAVVTL